MIDKILIVDDEFLIRQLLEETAARANIETMSAASGEEAVEILKKNEFQMAFVDLKMGKMSGIDVLKFARNHCPKMLFVIMTAYGTVETAVEAMKLGAFDFIIKPFPPDQMDIIIVKGRQWLEMNERQRYFQGELTGEITGSKGKPIGSSKVMEKVNHLVARVAPTDATVLITGESGTGKELIASQIHSMSPRGQGNAPYIRLNCAAVPETLLESELFGHEKGAFTGAMERRVGRFELADKGTLLLDEISEISTGMQAKLLRVLQESEFERVGGSKTIKVNVRVIATTNRNLQEEVEKGNFRQDLFYRLNVFPIHLPPLREREEDAVEIARYFLNRQCKKFHRKLEFSDEALECIKNYSWPGNVRELENIIERTAILADGPVIDANDLPAELLGEGEIPGESKASIKTSENIKLPTFNLKELERISILQALHQTGGNRTRAAELLGCSVRTLRNKLHEYPEIKAEVSDDEQ